MVGSRFQSLPAYYEVTLRSAVTALSMQSQVASALGLKRPSGVNKTHNTTPFASLQTLNDDLLMMSQRLSTNLLQLDLTVPNVIIWLLE